MRATAISAVLALAMAGVSLATLASAEARQQRAQSPAHSVPPLAARVDINHASVAELMKVPGMTRSWAGRIVRFRPYRAKSDLLDRGVLPSGVYDRTKDYLIAHRAKQ